MSPEVSRIGWLAYYALQVGALLVLLGSLWGFARYLKDAQP